jgi:hypothetical protein
LQGGLRVLWAPRPPAHLSTSLFRSFASWSSGLVASDNSRWLGTQEVTLPLPPREPAHPSAIMIYGGVAPTPAKRWVIQRQRTFGFPNVHRITWLPLKGTRRMLWLRWLWGNVPWEGCAPPPPWEKTVSQCPLCNTCHGNTVHLKTHAMSRLEDTFPKSVAQSLGGLV